MAAAGEFSTPQQYSPPVKNKFKGEHLKFKIWLKISMWAPVTLWEWK